jgi:hypothetical protein
VGGGADCRAGSADSATEYNAAIAARHSRSYAWDGNANAEHGSSNAWHGNPGAGRDNHSRNRNSGNCAEHDSNSGNDAKHQSDPGNGAD